MRRLPITVKTLIDIENGQGGYSQAWVESGFEFGSARPTTANEVTRGGQDGEMITHIAYLESRTIAKAGDRLEIEGRLLRVLAIREPGFAGGHKEADCILTMDAVK